MDPGKEMAVPEVGPDPELLAGMPIFGGLPPPALNRLAAGFAHRSARAGEAVVQQGDLDQELFVIASGSVEVIRDAESGAEPLARLGVGDCFGEMALIEIRPRAATVRALEDTRLFSISNRVFLGLHRDEPETFVLVVLNLARELSRRLREADRRLCARSTEPG